MQINNQRPKFEWCLIERKVYMRLLEPLVYTAKNGEQWKIEAGFYTNGASIMRALWSFLNPFDVSFKANVLHDFLVKEFKNGLNKQYFADNPADLIKWRKSTEYYREALKDLTITPHWKISIICRAVNLNGRINHRGNF